MRRESPRESGEVPQQAMIAINTMRSLMFRAMWIGLTILPLAFGQLQGKPTHPRVPKEIGEMNHTTGSNDRDQIIEHIHGLFNAYIRKDREAIRRGHTEDWRGFQVRSDHIVR